MNVIITCLLLILTACSTKKNIQNMENTLKDGTAKFCFIGDMGVATELQGKVAQMLKDESCHSIHMVGDLIYPSGIRSVDDPILESKFLKYYRPIAHSGHGPKLNLIMGNHDYKGNPKAWQELSEQENYITHPHPYFLQNYNGLCIAHLESNYYKMLFDFFKAQGQISWLKSIEKYMKDQCKTTIALTHHPYKSRGPNHGDANGYMKEFLENHVVGKFDYHISGHEHILSDEGKVNGTRLFITGAGGRFEPNEDVGFLVMEAEINKGTLSGVKTSFKRFRP